MKQLRQNLDFSKTYGSVPESFEARVQEALRKTAQVEQTNSNNTTTSVPRRPVLRVAIIVAALLMLTVTAVAAVLFQTGEFFLGPNGLPGAMDIFQHDMEVGQKAYSGDRIQVGDVAFVLDDVLWGEEHIYATGTFQLAESADHVMLMDFGCEPHHRYAPYGTELEDTTMTYTEYAEQMGLTLLSVEIWFNGVMDAQGEFIRMETSYYYMQIAEGVFRFALMVFPDEEELQAAREGGYRGSFDITVHNYGEGSTFIPPDDDDPWGYWQPGSSVTEKWVLDLSPES